jgi:ATPase subunit of ABC transporter with duplicated ATPase domains
MIDHKLLCRLCRRRSRREYVLLESKEEGEEETTATSEDENVVQERYRILSGRTNIDTILPGSEDLIQVINCTKTFGQQRAVNNVTFGVKQGELFGLLGPNGAGKTTLLKYNTSSIISFDIES